MKCLTHDIEVNYPCSPVCPLYGDCIASFSREVKRRVRTNADHIRAMSDEELAMYFAGMADEDIYNDPGAWLAWLQNSYKGGKE